MEYKRTSQQPKMPGARGEVSVFGHTSCKLHGGDLLLRLRVARGVFMASFPNIANGPS